MVVGPFIFMAVGAGIALTGLAVVFGLVVRLLTGGDLADRLDTYTFIPETSTRQRKDRVRSGMNRLRVRLNAMLSVLTSDEMSLKLASAGWPITETEYVLIRIWATVGALILGWVLFKSILPGLGLAVIAFLVPAIYLNRSITQRRTKFSKQLVDILVLVTGAVRAGYSFLQSLDVVVQEMKAPASEEFRRVRREVGLGVPLSNALMNMHARMQNDDLYLVITAVNINSQVGGNLATMLEVVTSTIRERVRLFSEIRALTSQQRYSGYLLTMLPFIITGILFVISPDYIGRLFEPGLMILVPITSLILVLLGNIVIRILSKIDF